VLAGHLGAHVLGAVAIGGNVMALGILTIIGVMMAISPSVAQLDGAGKRAEIGPMFRQALFLALAVGIVLQACMYFGGPLLARVMGVDATLLDDTDAYLHAGSFAVLPLALYMACRGLSEGLSIMRPGMFFSVGGLILLAPVGYALMYPLGMGPAGAGLAMAVMMWGQFGAFAVFLLLDRRYRGLGWERGKRGPDFAAILPLLRIGIPMGASVLMEAGLFTIAGLAIGRFGAVAVSSHQIALSVASVTFMIPLGLAMATTVRVGNAVGRGDPDGVRTAGHAGMALALGAQAIAALLMLGLSQQIAGLYADDPQVVAGAASLLFLAALFQLSDGLQVTCNGALRGLKDARTPLLITGFSYWVVGMPIGWFFAFAQDWQTPGMWLGLVAGLSTAAILLFLRFQSLSRRTVSPALAQASQGG
jgi:MATE family multidrug resistance protein